jgi:hypothetical protein
MGDEDGTYQQKGATDAFSVMISVPCHLYVLTPAHSRSKVNGKARLDTAV